MFHPWFIQCPKAVIWSAVLCRNHVLQQVIWECSTEVAVLHKWASILSALSVTVLLWVCSWENKADGPDCQHDDVHLQFRSRSGIKTVIMLRYFMHNFRIYQYRRLTSARSFVLSSLCVWGGRCGCVCVRAQVRSLKLEQEVEKNKILSEALQTLATEHHELEQSVVKGSSPRSALSEDDFHDAVSGELTRYQRHSGRGGDSVTSSRSLCHSPIGHWNTFPHQWIPLVCLPLFQPWVCRAESFACLFSKENEIKQCSIRLGLPSFQSQFSFRLTLNILKLNPVCH